MKNFLRILAERTVGDRQPALILAIVEYRFVGVEDHGPRASCETAREIGEPVARDRVCLSRERAVLGRRANPSNVVWELWSGGGTGSLRGRNAPSGRARGACDDQEKCGRDADAHGSEYHECAARVERSCAPHTCVTSP